MHGNWKIIYSLIYFPPYLFRRLQLINKRMQKDDQLMQHLSSDLSLMSWWYIHTSKAAHPNIHISTHCHRRHFTWLFFNTEMYIQHYGIALYISLYKVLSRLNIPLWNWGLRRHAAKLSLALRGKVQTRSFDASSPRAIPSRPLATTSLR